MNWFRDNTLGVALASVAGVLIVVSLLLSVLWTRPVEVGAGMVATTGNLSGDRQLAVHEVGPLSDYEVINQRPVFNESRLPEVIEVGDDEPVVDTTIEVKDPPDVKLTGVIITPAMKIVTLTPAKGNQESVMAHQGETLTGEYVGWQVSSIRPRRAVLKSRKGETLALDLEVHDAQIQAPARPAPRQQVSTAQTGADAPADQAVEDGQPTDRAEQIRQRIAERREELRREQEARQAEGNRGAADGRSQYQAAIQAMMNNSRRNRDGNDDGK